MPAASQTERTAAPAMIPVPGPAGIRSTWPAPIFPPHGMGNRAVHQGDLCHLPGACLLAFSTLGGTSLALPYPQPTLPLPSPTMVMAAKLKRRPPFTTAAQRRMLTTRLEGRFAITWSVATMLLLPSRNFAILS